MLKKFSEHIIEIWRPDQHPRAPEGASGGHGGEFVSKHDPLQHAVTSLKPHLAGYDIPWRRTAKTEDGRLAYPNHDAEREQQKERLHDRMQEAVKTLQQAHVNKSIPNPHFKDAADWIRRGIENATQDYEQQNRDYSRGENPTKPSMSRDELNTHVKNLKQLVKDTKPLIVKRQPKTAEQKEKERFVNTDPNAVGHCQICGEKIMAAKGVIAHHGYKRPGTGWQTKSCPGARFQPYEVSRDRIPEIADKFKTQVAEMKETLTKMMKRPPATLPYEKYNYRAGTKEKLQAERPVGFNPANERGTYKIDDVYTPTFFKIKRDLENQIEGGEEMMDYLQKRYKDWKKVR